MGRKISLLALKRILEIMWGKNGSIDVIDLGNDFFWSNFNLEDAVIDKIAAWIRLHGLAIEYYNRTILEKIGNIIGRTIKVDTNTADVSRGKIARICVEVDLEKPLVSQYQINGKTHLVEYEGIHLVCFHCGMVGHEKQNYPGRQKQNQSCIHQGSEAEEVQRSGSEVEDRGKDGKKEKEKGKSVITEEAEAFGPWMIVQRPTRGKKPNKSGEDTSSGGSAKEKEKENTVRENQSRFATLENVVPEYERIDVREKEDSTIEKDKDLGSVGSKFTWKGGQRSGLERVFKRLDRGLANAEWRRDFSDARIDLLPRVNSDHYPLLANLRPGRVDTGEKPFRFETSKRDYLMSWNRFLIRKSSYGYKSPGKGGL
ncbi:hypothetical protein AHAS_Ahas02G0187800 [Arachis hypogaea]